MRSSTSSQGAPPAGSASASASRSRSATCSSVRGNGSRSHSAAMLSQSSSRSASDSLRSCYARRRSEESVLYGVVQQELETFLARGQERERSVPRFVERELRGLLHCGVLAHGFVRVRCDACGLDRVVAFSCKGRGFCPSCGGRRTADTAAHLVARVLPEVPVLQWVLSLPWQLRNRLAYDVLAPGILVDEVHARVCRHRHSGERGRARRSPRAGRVRSEQRPLKHRRAAPPRVCSRMCRSRAPSRRPRQPSTLRRRGAWSRCRAEASSERRRRDGAGRELRAGRRSCRPPHGRADDRSGAPVPSEIRSQCTRSRR